jgi:hypothetical protein
MKRLLALLLTLPALAQERLLKEKDAVAPLTIRAEDVSYWNVADSVQFHGTLTLPAEGTRFPAVVLISGSGPQDRDGRMPSLPKAPLIYKTLAEYLTQRGIAVLRVDDRGFGKSTLGKNPAQATAENLALDAAAGLAYLKTRSEIDRRQRGLIGHSEGGFVAALLASRSREVAFVVSLAGPGESGGDVSIKQNRQVLRQAGIDSTSTEAFIREFHEPVIRAIQVGQDTAQLRGTILTGIRALRARVAEPQLQRLGFRPGIEPLVVKQYLALATTPGLRFFITVPPTRYWERVRRPVLALNGSLDQQVEAKVNLRMIEGAPRKGGNRRVRVEELLGLNHLFQVAQTGALSEYQTLGTDFDSSALERIADWIRETTR